jgi:hypothetical protein
MLGDRRGADSVPAVVLGDLVDQLLGHGTKLRLRGGGHPGELGEGAVLVHAVPLHDDAQAKPDGGVERRSTAGVRV